MMPRQRRVARAVVVVAVVVVALGVVLTGFAPASSSKPTPTPPTPAYSPPPKEESPFSGPDDFCTADGDRFDSVGPKDPTLLSQRGQVVWLLAPDAPPVEPDAIETFARLVDECGGIGGRRLDVHVVRETGDPHADCLAATTKYHPVMVVSTEASPAWSCIVRDQGTVLVTGADVANADLEASSGRLVATGSSEGVEEARVLDLVDSGRLDGHRVAIVAGDDAIGARVRHLAQTALSTKGITPVELGRADVVLTPSIALDAVPDLLLATQRARHHQPLDVYGFDSASAALPTAVAQLEPSAAARLLSSAHLYAFSSPDDPVYRAGASPNTFSSMCNRAAATAVTTRAAAASTTTTEPPGPPLTATYLTTADVCLLTRIVSRSLFAAGPTLDQRAIITALHRLPYVDQAAPAGTPKPRPNQVVNEPVRRIEQVVVVEQLQPGCPTSSDTTTTTLPYTDPCWAPVSGWDDGGSVVNVPLATTPVTISH